MIKRFFIDSLRAEDFDVSEGHERITDEICDGATHYIDLDERSVLAPGFGYYAGQEQEMQILEFLRRIEREDELNYDFSCMIYDAVFENRQGDLKWEMCGRHHDLVQDYLHTFARSYGYSAYQHDRDGTVTTYFLRGSAKKLMDKQAA